MFSACVVQTPGLLLYFVRILYHQENLFFPWVSLKYIQRLQEHQRAGRLERDPEQGDRGTVFLEVSGLLSGCSQVSFRVLAIAPYSL